MNKILMSLCAVPLAAVAYTRLRAHVAHRLIRKGYPADTASYYGPDPDVKG